MNYILFFGRVSKYKGIEYLVEAFDKINKKNINIKLVIAGEGDLWFEKHKISNNKNIIIINRYIDTPELVRLISNCLFVVAPYTDATNSGVVMNSFAFNKPVIASDVGGLREVIKDGITGLLVESKNVDSLKEKIEYLIDNPALLEKMGNNIAGMRKDSEISWNNITEKCIEIYNNVIMNFNL